MPGVEDLFDDAADESDDGGDYKPGAGAAADEAEEAAEGEEGEDGSPPGSPEGEGDDLEDSSGECRSSAQLLHTSACWTPQRKCDL